MIVKSDIFESKEIVDNSSELKDIDDAIYEYKEK